MTQWILDGRLPDARTSRGSFVFLVGTILNQNISGVAAWRGTRLLSERVDLTPRGVRRLPAGALREHIAEKPSVHPFATAMARAIVSAADRVHDQYGGDTRRVWRSAESLEVVTKRLVEFRQIGLHKANVAMYILSSVFGELGGRGAHAAEICPSLVVYLGAFDRQGEAYVDRRADIRRSTADLRGRRN